MRILFCGDGPMVDTGFGTVSRNLLKYWKELGHEIGVMAINWFGDPYDKGAYPYTIWPVDKGNLDLLYGYQKFWYIEEQFKPDIIFFLNDPWVIQKYLHFKPEKPRLEYVKMVAYYPTDAGPMKSEWIKMLNEFDAQVCYSNFAERVLIESNENKRPKNLYQIYHGVDTETYRPVNQSLARASLGLPTEAFIIGMVARNQYRKRFDILAQAFDKFSKDKPEAKLYLHTAVNDVGYDILNISEQFHFGDKLILTEDVTPNQGVPAHVLNLIYNSFDINALISLGDGFGLPVAESMATGCVQLVSGHSCLQELVEGHGGLTVKTAAWIMNTSGINTWGGVTDVDDLVAKLNTLYESKDLRVELATQGYEYIRQEQFQWKYAAYRFNDIFKKIMRIFPIEKGVILDGITNTEFSDASLAANYSY